MLFGFFKLIPGRIRRARDAGDTQGKVVGIGALSESLIIGDKFLLEQPHEGLIKGLHAIGNVPL